MQGLNQEGDLFGRSELTVCYTDHGVESSELRWWDPAELRSEARSGIFTYIIISRFLGQKSKTFGL